MQSNEDAHWNIAFRKIIVHNLFHHLIDSSVEQLKQTLFVPMLIGL